MDYETVVTRFAKKGTGSFWHNLAQSAWTQCGGSEAQSHLFAEAYSLGAVAASILDDIQDQDGANPLWQSIGVAPAINVGVGLAFRVLGIFGLLELPPDCQNRLLLFYARTVEKMCQGQHRDLTNGLMPPTLNEAWSIVGEKTAAWCAFGVGAYAEAIEDERVSTLIAIGRHIGCWHQIGNDLGSVLEDDGKYDLLNRKHTVLSAYAFAVAKGTERDALWTAWQAVDKSTTLNQVRELLLDLGVEQYATVMGNYHLAEANRLADELGMRLPIPLTAHTFINKWAPVETISKVLR